MFNDYKFHPSQLGLIMTESRTNDAFGETAKAHLLECWIGKKYDRHKDVTNQYLEKGTLAEEDSIDLYSVVKKQYFEKNKERISNDYFIGTPDLYIGNSIFYADVIIDLKTSWDIFTFYSVMLKGLDKRYFWQLQAYMDMTGANTSKLVYCLVNTPVKLIEDEKKKLMWRMGVIDPDADEAYVKACSRIDKNSIYDDIPMEERYIEFEVERDQSAIAKAHQRVLDCREFLNKL
jgi:hypothetical protein